METTTKHCIRICLGSSCYSRGNAENLETIKSYLKDNNIESQIDFRGHLCTENCNKGPVIEIDDQTFEEVSNSSLTSILNHFFNEKQ
ncbi:(2Fe-2S) ferredoxin domain-containing protein [Marinilabiliaceae bacterium JC017]|nr:(2Fe-2S) ferredoxin domain-containing protein [Marinilabiliaceae bacterium JC017]